MRHRAVSAVRVYDRCARCGTTYLANYDVRKVTAFIDGRRHELVVCAACDESPDEPTMLEQAAMACDLSNPVEVMDFMQGYRSDPGRVLRTAEHFLPADVFADTKVRVERKAAEIRAALAMQDEKRLARLAEGYLADPDDEPEDTVGDFGYGDHYDEDDDDLPF